MGLDNFETDGPRTWTDRDGTQRDFDSDSASDFEDEWGIALHEASSDNEFLAERISEADSFGEICEMFMWLEHTVISKAAVLVEEGHLDKDDLPESTHPDYNEHEASWYVEQRNKNNPISSFGSSSSTTTSDNQDDSDSGGALSAFKSS